MVSCFNLEFFLPILFGDLWLLFYSRAAIDSNGAFLLILTWIYDRAAFIVSELWQECILLFNIFLFLVSLFFTFCFYFCSCAILCVVRCSITVLLFPFLLLSVRSLDCYRFARDSLNVFSLLFRLQLFIPRIYTKYCKNLYLDDFFLNDITAILLFLFFCGFTLHLFSMLWYFGVFHSCVWPILASSHRFHEFLLKFLEKNTE